MGNSYSQLTDDERIEMYAMMHAGNSKSEIIRQLGRSPSTIYREIRRNTGQRGYRPKQAHEWATQRRKQSPKSIKMNTVTVGYINEKLGIEWSPEQISDRMKTDPNFSGNPVSHERIYQHIWQDKKQGGSLYKQLRLANNKKKRKRYAAKDDRGKIRNRKDIDQRPKIVERKERIGDWEADLVVGAGATGYLVTLVERVSKLTLIGFVRFKTSERVTDEIVRMLWPHRTKVHTITFDNGREFAGHEQIAERLDCQCYFAKPYHSWERGLNENTNGLIRQYFPKKQPFARIQKHQLDLVMHRLNTRPRKTLDFVAPEVIYYKTVRLIA